MSDDPNDRGPAAPPGPSGDSPAADHEVPTDGVAGVTSDPSSAEREGPASGGVPAPEEPATSSPLAAVIALRDERRRYEAWLTALEARRADTPARVFARVHADYTTRLERVVQQLATHAGAIRAELEALTARLAELDASEQQVRDERAEAELRAHVGELPGSEWERTTAESDARLAELDAERARLTDGLARARELLGEAERPPIASAPPHEEPRTASVPDDATRAPASVLADERDAEPPASLPPSASWAAGEEASEAPPPLLPPAVLSAEAALLEADAAADGSPAAPGDSGSPPRPRPGFDELAFLSAVVDTPTRSVDLAPRTGAEARDSAGAAGGDADAIVNLDAAAPVSDERADASVPLGANVSGNSPIVLNESREGSKTLKCGDCGAMNRPTEWYCERCGAELASL